MLQGTRGPTAPAQSDPPRFALAGTSTLATPSDCIPIPSAGRTARSTLRLILHCLPDPTQSHPPRSHRGIRCTLPKRESSISCCKRCYIQAWRCRRNDLISPASHSRRRPGGVLLHVAVLQLAKASADPKMLGLARNRILGGHPPKKRSTLRLCCGFSGSKARSAWDFRSFGPWEACRNLKDALALVPKVLKCPPITYFIVNHPLRDNYDTPSGINTNSGCPGREHSASCLPAHDRSVPPHRN